MANAFCLSFLCLIQLSAPAVYAEHSSPKDSMRYGQLAIDLEGYLNSQQIPIDENGNVKILLSLDEQQRFAPIVYNRDHEKANEIVQALSDYDRQTGKLSKSLDLADPDYVYLLEAFMDKEFERFWFTKIEKARRDEAADAAFITYEVVPRARDGMKALLSSAIMQMKADPKTARFFKTDTMVVSFIVDNAETNVPKKVRVDGVKNRTMRRIVVNSGVWNPGVYYGRLVPAYVEVEFYKALYATDKTKSIHGDGRSFCFIMFPTIRAAERMQITYSDPGSRVKPDATVVSFILNGNVPVMYGEMTVQGDQKVGKRLLRLLKKHLKGSPLIGSFHPSRLYVSFSTNLLKRSIPFP